MATSIEVSEELEKGDDTSLNQDDNLPRQPDDGLIHDDYRIALYYCYLDVADVQQHCEFQTRLCERLSLKGRIRVAEEGINGVLSGLVGNLHEYSDALQCELANLSTRPNDNEEDAWELDVKFCQLRPDLSVSEQLFDHLSVKETKKVICLLGTSDAPPSKKSTRKSRRKNRQQSKGESDKGCDNKPNIDEDMASSAALARYAEQLYARGQETQQPAIHLSPREWEKRLSQVAATKENNKGNKKTLLLDCRNVYESNIGRFQAPNADTVLTNTRKFSELPHVLVQQADTLAESDEIYMYCTGGVRCESASMFLQSLLADKCREKETTPQVYQLHGGIQRYLETNATKDSYFQGKNFVFDQRRHDPVHNGHVIGKCLVCDEAHDDYDSGEAPCKNNESRCWSCRILVLVCDNCRLKVSCWNEVNDKPRVYCGGVEGKCHHMPPVEIISGS